MLLGEQRADGDEQWEHKRPWPQPRLVGHHVEGGQCRDTGMHAGKAIGVVIVFLD